MLEEEFYSLLYSKNKNTVFPLNGKGIIYYNNIINNRIEALLDIFPAITACLGDEYIRHIAKDYCQKNDAIHGNLNLYGHNFGLYLSSLEECKIYKYIKDLADFEYITQILLYKKDSDFLSPNKFLRLIQNSKPAYLASQATVFTSIYPIFEISNFCLGKTQIQPDMTPNQDYFYHYFLYRDIDTLKVFVEQIPTSVVEIIPILRTKGVLSIDNSQLSDPDINEFTDFLIKKQLWVETI